MVHGLGKRIQLARTRKLYTQKTLCDLMGLHKETISRWEREVAAPTPENMRDLCRLLDISAEWLMTGQEGGVVSSAAREIGIFGVDWGLVIKITKHLTKRRVPPELQKRAYPAIYTWVCRRGDDALTDEAVDTILDSIPS